MAKRKYNLLLIFTLLAVTNVLAMVSGDSACADENLCVVYKSKLKEALDSCDLGSYFILKELNRGIGSDCIGDVDKEILSGYYTTCFQQRIVQAVYDCNLDMMKEEEEIVKSRLNNLPTFTIMREMLRHAKCSDFSDRCFQKELAEAISKEEWSKIIEVEQIIDSKTFKICSNHSKLAELVKKTKLDYFKRWIPKRLSEAIEKQNLEEVYNLENFTFQVMQDSPGFQEMRDEFLSIKCQEQDEILQNVLTEAIDSCDINRILHFEDLMVNKWKKNCPDYDYDALKEFFHQTKLSSLNKCFKHMLTVLVNSCDLGRILDLERTAESVNESDMLKDVSTRKCFDLVKCIIKDVEHTVNTCDQDRLHHLQTLIRSNIFSKCDNYKRFKKILNQGKRAITSQCVSSSEIENTKAETGKARKVK
jgi:hypothetical protein